MRKVALQLGVIAGMIIMLAFVSCTKEWDGDIQSNDPQEADAPVDKKMIHELAKLFDGEYNGVWTFNGQGVKPDNFFQVGIDKNNKNGGSYYDKSYYDSYIGCYADSNRIYHSLYEFPLMATTNYLLADLNVSYFTLAPYFDNVWDKEQLLQSFISENISNVIPFGSGIDLDPIGYSEKTLYFYLKQKNNDYIRFSYIATMTNGTYIGIILNINPNESTVTMDLSTKVITITYTIPQVKLLAGDADITIELDPAIKITFTSINKITRGGVSGD
ncbi:MAG: hypothetical protein IJ647_08700 [Prevotella sp.]|nr:hypothetical protein [Prevotella sp.]